VFIGRCCKTRQTEKYDRLAISSNPLMNPPAYIQSFENKPPKIISFSIILNYLNEFVKVGSALADIIILDTMIEYLKPFDEWNICNVHLQRKKNITTKPHVNHNSFDNPFSNMGTHKEKEWHTKLNWPRKNGPSLNFPKAASILSTAAANET
jgi:hypothetical protein